MRFDDKGEELRPVGEVELVARIFEEVALVAVSAWCSGCRYGVSLTSARFSGKSLKRFTGVDMIRSLSNNECIDAGDVMD